MTAPLMQASRQWASGPRARPISGSRHSLTCTRGHHHREVAAEQKGVSLSNLRVTTEQDAEGIAHPGARHEDDGQDRAVHALRSASWRGGWAPGEVPARSRRGSPRANLNDGLSELRRVETRRAAPTPRCCSRRTAPRAAGAHERQVHAHLELGRHEAADRAHRGSDRGNPLRPRSTARAGSTPARRTSSRFMVDDDRRIFETLPGGGLSRGFFISNSEVGDASFSLTTFLYQYVCGNHMVWGAQGVKNIRIPHIGDADERAFRRSPSSFGSTRRVGGGGRGEDREDDRVRVQGHEGRSARHDLQADRHPEGTSAQAIEIATRARIGTATRARSSRSSRGSPRSLATR
jgi:hypothetical protein